MSLDSNKICNSCGSKNSSEVNYCIYCGSDDLNEISFTHDNLNGEITCESCGYVNSNDNSFCENCGCPLLTDEKNDCNYETEYKPETNSENKFKEFVQSDTSEKNNKSKVLQLLLICAFIMAFVWIGVRTINNNNTKESSLTDNTLRTVESNESELSVSTPTATHNLPYEVDSSSYKEFVTLNGCFNRVKASSYANWSGTIGYPDMAFDNKNTSAWQDGIKNDYAVGEWLLSYNSNGSIESIDSITVYNGYQNTSHNTGSKDFYKLNSRVREFTLEFDDGKTMSFSLSDTKQPQIFYFGSTIQTCYVRFRIDDIYKGDSYKDVCISEIIYR